MCYESKLHWHILCERSVPHILDSYFFHCLLAIGVITLRQIGC